MIGAIATLRIKEDKTEAFEAFFAELTRQVRANEPGCLTYQLTRSRTEPTTYKVFEVYADQDALSAHQASAHFKTAGPQFAATLAARADIEYLDALG